MKLRTDFVSNSSSTSFILILKDDWSIERLGKLMGIPSGSALWPIVNGLFDAIQLDQAAPATFYGTEDTPEAIAKEIESDFSVGIANRVRAALHAGQRVMMGRLRSDGPATEAFLCTESFELDDGGLYLNGLRCYW